MITTKCDYCGNPIDSGMKRVYYQFILSNLDGDLVENGKNCGPHDFHDDCSKLLIDMVYRVVSVALKYDGGQVRTTSTLLD